ncbi:hypothetical protein [Rhodococcus sp. BH5]|uniref:hypothetical protein n=1 Tax=Rhodococcus sp. BH5 TaxID=2871702 RepID=UPI0022CDA455|nr:hypothetical protein [Rhodococcus sp. BH5]MCZ9635265.1 hypothetical protein [Rhodococcus sp. BH5]
MMCAATVTNGDVASLKGELNRIRPKGSSRIRMKNVGKDAGRIVNAVAEPEAHPYLFVVKRRCATRVARDMALTGTFTRLQELGTTRAVIESCSQDSEDRRVIRSVLGGSPTMEYIHEPAGSNLFVVDGALLPGSSALVNPALTIISCLAPVTNGHRM